MASTKWAVCHNYSFTVRWDSVRQISVSEHTVYTVRILLYNTVHFGLLLLLLDYLLYILLQ